jgi:hypothetical protein
MSGAAGKGPATGTHRRAPRPAGEWTDVKGASTIVGITEKSVRSRVSRHQLPFRRLGGQIIFNRAVLVDFLDKLNGVTLGEALANAAREASPQTRTPGDVRPGRSSLPCTPNPR